MITDLEDFKTIPPINTDEKLLDLVMKVSFLVASAF